MFDKYAASAGYADVSTTLTPENHTLSNITLGGNTVAAGNYTVSGGQYTFKKEYLATLGTGAQVFTFIMSGGANPTFTVTVSNSTPAPIYSGGSGSNFSSLRIVNNIITITQLDGTRARLGVQATGGYPPYTYRYQMKGSWIDIPGATSAEFTWEGLTPGQTYTVRCVVKDSRGNTVTSPEKTFIAGEGLSAFPVKAEITSKNVNVRPEANTKGKRLSRLQIGDEVSILGYTAPKGYPNGFFKIAWDNAARFAYISADYVNVTFTTLQGANITGRVYLQSQMNTAKKYRVATLSNGNTAKLLGRYKAWWVVEWQGERVYMKNGKYIQP